MDGAMLPPPEVPLAAPSPTFPPLGIPTPTARPTLPAFPPEPTLSRSQQALRLVAAGLASAMAARGNRPAAIGVLTGVNQGIDNSLQWQRAERIRTIGRDRYQFEIDQRAFEQEQQQAYQRKKDLAQLLTSARQEAGKIQTRPEHDAFVKMADAHVTGALGLPPGSFASKLPFVPPPVRQRASDALTRLESAAKSRGIAVHQIGATQFDIDGDGQLETVPLSKLQELAGVSMLDADGQPLKVEPSTVQTFGDLFTSARGTPFEKKPLPMRSGQIDYGEASLLLQRMGLTTSADDRRQARAESQRQVRDDLRGAILRGASDAEVNALRTTLRRVGLSPEVEIAAVRKELLAVGQGLQTPEEKSALYGAGTYPSADALITRGRDALTGPASSPTPKPSPPPTRQEMQQASTEARRQLEAARRAAGDPRPVTDAEVAVVLQKPGNLDRLRGAAPEADTLAPGRYRYVEGQGFVPVEAR